MISRLLYLFIFSAILFSCHTPEARRPIKRQSGTFIKESAIRNKELYDQERDYISQLMQKDSSKTYYSSEKGFWYYYNKKDSIHSETPEVGDIVRFTYNIKDLNGNNILSEEENGIQNYKVDQSNQELISGVREGIKIMKEGETVTFIIPSYKAYGYYGIQNKLGTNVPVQSTVHLLSIDKQEKPNKP